MEVHNGEDRGREREIYVNAMVAGQTNEQIMIKSDHGGRGG